MKCIRYSEVYKPSKNEIVIDGMTYGERELSQLIRRKMLTRFIKNKKKYTRKNKHKINLIDNI